MQPSFTKSVCCLLVATTVIACQSAPEQDAPAVDLPSIEFPVEIDGALDEGWEIYVMRYDNCVTQEKSYCEVFDRAKKDTYIAQLLANTVIQQKSIEELSGLTQSEFDAFVERQTKENDEWLNERIQSRGWFNISDYGADADKAAFFIVQHSGDVNFQRKILEVLKPLVAADETSKSSFALLSDRIAIKDGLEQLYASQGECSGDGAWTPFPVVSGDVDERRIEMTLEPLADYVSRMSSFC